MRFDNVSFFFDGNSIIENFNLNIMQGDKQGDKILSKAYQGE
jgi:ABC-type multidrug transport system fused ATPase/permease subunit